MLVSTFPWWTGLGKCFLLAGNVAKLSMFLSENQFAPIYASRYTKARQYGNENVGEIKFSVLI